MNISETGMSGWLLLFIENQNPKWKIAIKSDTHRQWKTLCTMWLSSHSAVRTDLINKHIIKT